MEWYEKALIAWLIVAFKFSVVIVRLTLNALLKLQCYR